MSNHNQIFSISIQNAHLHFIIHSESFIQKHTEQWQKAFHAHIYYEILVSLSETNKLIIDKEELPFEKDTFAIIRPYQHHSAYVENVANIISIGFFYESDKTAKEKYDICALIDKFLASKNNICRFDTALSDALMKLRSFGNRDDQISEGLITSLLLQIFYNMLSLLMEQADGAPPQDDTSTTDRNHLPRRNAFDLLCKVNDLLNARYMEDITPQSLSRELYISPKQINRYMSSLYNQTFMQRRTALRITAAQKLLRESTNSIAWISAAVGYHSINTFYSAFKTFCGVTPDKYRSSNDRVSQAD